jgi:hypothetical protein
MSFFSRRNLIGAALIGAVIAFFFALAYLDSERGAFRTVYKALVAFEADDTDAFAKLIATDYSDAAGLNAEEVRELAHLFRLRLSTCSVSRTEKDATFDDVTRTGKLAFSLRLNGKFHNGDNVWFYTARAPVPVTFTLRHESWKPWDWVITSVETPYGASLRQHLATWKNSAAKRETR